MSDVDQAVPVLVATSLPIVVAATHAPGAAHVMTSTPVAPSGSTVTRHPPRPGVVVHHTAGRSVSPHA